MRQAVVAGYVGGLGRRLGGSGGAVAAGGEDAAGDRYRLGSKEICLGGRNEATDMLPDMLQDLLVRSDNLYRRIARLDDVLFGQTGGQAGVKAHFDRLNQAFGPN